MHDRGRGCCIKIWASLSFYAEMWSGICTLSVCVSRNLHQHWYSSAVPVMLHPSWSDSAQNLHNCVLKCSDDKVTRTIECIKSNTRLASALFGLQECCFYLNLSYEQCCLWALQWEPLDRALLASETPLGYSACICTAQPWSQPCHDTLLSWCWEGVACLSSCCCLSSTWVCSSLDLRFLSCMVDSWWQQCWRALVSPRWQNSSGASDRLCLFALCNAVLTSSRVATAFLTPMAFSFSVSIFPACKHWMWAAVCQNVL